MTNIAQVLRDARALIDKPDKWIKGAYKRGGCFCTLGAIARARGLHLSEAWHGSKFAKINEYLPDGFSYVGVFNDHPDTTHADIMALFDRAIAAAEAEAV